MSIFAELREEPGEGGGGGGGGSIDDYQQQQQREQQQSPRSSTSSLSMLLSPSPGHAAAVAAALTTTTTANHGTASRVVDIGGGQSSDSLVAADGGDARGAAVAGAAAAAGGGVTFKSRRRATMERVVAAAIVMCLVGYALVGEFAYVTHPDVQSNMLNSYGTDDPWMLAASASMGLSAIGSYPINHFSSRAALDDVLSAAFGWRAAAPGMAPAGRHVTQTLLFLALTTAVSLRVKDLGKVFQLVGSTAGGGVAH